MLRGMRRLTALAAALLLASALSAAVSGASTFRPTLRLADQRPVVVFGQHFRPRERVRLVPSNGPAVSVQASRAGSFSVTLTRTFIARCGGFFIRATGTRGSLATLKLPRPACLPY
jgi:hypothetical protein